ncbi:OprD family outer membrane porin [Neptuniibacter halophilus]|uniref:OprD family outer membrane porin n=1 Tax=Neptuniibacter halophilus TaxID=651666 RepID=UPI0025728C75|nr:OprD family outer membrane porin [Neptuniibacter halophilus]
MKLKQLSVAVMALTALSGTQAMAAEGDNGWNVDLGFRTFYMNRDFDQGIPDTIAAGQAIRLDVDSPMWNDTIGFGLGAVHVAELIDEKTVNSSDVLNPEGDGYTTLEQAYIKFKPLDNLQINAGRMVLMTPLLNDLTSRISAPSTQGVHATASFENGSVYAIYSDEASMNNQEGFVPYAVNGEEYEIVSLGGTYKFANGLSTHLQYAVADDYQKQSYINVAYPTQLGDYDLMLDLTHMRGEDDGALYGSDYDSHLTGLTARLSQGNLAYTLAYQTIGGSAGYDQKWGGDDNTQFFTWGAVQLLDFNAKDEQSLQARIDYDVPSVPGLHLMARHTESWDIDYSGGDDGQRRETNVDVKYTLQEGAAKGLSMRLRVAKADGDAAVVPRINDIRFIVDYKTNLF